jgi:general stress protein YciG
MANENTGGSQRGGSGNFGKDPEKAWEAGKKGGEQSQGGSQKESDTGTDQSQRGGSGNFANNPERASEAGRKGGEHSQGGQR